MTGLRAIMVAVDYTDLLAVTLPYNRHHFDEICIVTDIKSGGAVEDVVSALPVKGSGSTIIYYTDAFYRGGARFNKWAALEEGLDYARFRTGWLSVMDADVLWPRDVMVREYGQSLRFLWPQGDTLLHRGELLTPLRRMAPWPPQRPTRTDGTYWMPPYEGWGIYPIHRNTREWAGYSQVFHASDPHLGPPPWHEVDWTHAGGADSLFQRKWPAECKRRPMWECLHLGEPGVNWFGRATADDRGEVPADAAEKLELVRGVWRGRAERRRLGMSEAETFRPEKLG